MSRKFDEYQTTSNSAVWHKLHHLRMMVNTGKCEWCSPHRGCNRKYDVTNWKRHRRHQCRNWGL